MSVLISAGALYMRTIRETWAGGTGLLLPLTYIVGGAALIPLVAGDAIGGVSELFRQAGALRSAPEGISNSDLLGLIAPGLLWFLIALASLVTLERIFQSDLEDGALDDYRLGPLPMEIVAFIKVIAVWSLTALPALFILPLPGLFLGLSPLDSLMSLPAFLLGSLAFFFWGGVGAALSASVRRSGLLIAVIVLPFYAPAVIFGSGAVAPLASGSGLDTTALMFLAASTLMSAAIGPVAAAQALKLGGEG